MYNMLRNKVDNKKNSTENNDFIHALLQFSWHGIVTYRSSKYAISVEINLSYLFNLFSPLCVIKMTENFH